LLNVINWKKGWIVFIFIEQGKGSEGILVLPADHLIEPVSGFILNVEEAGQLAEKDYLVTFGIKPGYPATGYGYIETGDKELNGFRVNSFKEKPNKQTAEKFIHQGNYFWNSGMFVFKAARFWEELEAGSPKIASVFAGIGANQSVSQKNGIKIIMANKRTEDVYKKSPKDSIDYAVMEKCSKVALVPATFEWNDIGSWDEMASLSLSRKDQRPLVSTFTVESKNNFILSDIPVALCGVEDLMVIQKNGSLLICRKGKGQLVKDAVEMIKEQDQTDLL